MNRDHVIYGDTDSCYVGIESFILDNIKDKSKWLDMTDDKKIEYVRKISEIMEDNLNKRTYTEAQKGDYNSQVKDFKIGFKQESIAKSALFIKKKKDISYLDVKHEYILLCQYYIQVTTF